MNRVVHYYCRDQRCQREDTRAASESDETDGNVARLAQQRAHAALCICAQRRECALMRSWFEIQVLQKSVPNSRLNQTIHTKLTEINVSSDVMWVAS